MWRSVMAKIAQTKAYDWYDLLAHWHLYDKQQILQTATAHHAGHSVT